MALTLATCWLPLPHHLPCLCHHSLHLLEVHLPCLCHHHLHSLVCHAWAVGLPVLCHHLHLLDCYVGTLKVLVLLGCGVLCLFFLETKPQAPSNYPHHQRAELVLKIKQWAKVMNTKGAWGHAWFHWPGATDEDKEKMAICLQDLSKSSANTNKLLTTIEGAL